MNTCYTAGERQFKGTCLLNGFGVISNDNILRTYLCKDMIHLEDLGTNVLTGFFDPSF